MAGVTVVFNPLAGDGLCAVEEKLHILGGEHRHDAFGMGFV
jgi:hypothetical protein